MINYLDTNKIKIGKNEYERSTIELRGEKLDYAKSVARFTSVILCYNYEEKFVLIRKERK